MNNQNKRTFTFRKACAFVSIFGFTASLVTHLISWLGFSLYNPFVWLLHFGSFLIVILTVFYVLNVQGGEIWKRELFTNRLFGLLPKKLHFAILAVFIYALLNSIWIDATKPNGLANSIDGKYVLLSEEKTENKRVIREITLEEFNLLNAKNMRNISGYWMFLYLISALYFWKTAKKEVSE